MSDVPLDDDATDEERLEAQQHAVAGRLCRQKPLQVAAARFYAIVRDEALRLKGDDHAAFLAAQLLLDRDRAERNEEGRR